MDEETESSWCRQLVKLHGVNGVIVGPCPYSVHERCWISSRTEEAPSHEEVATFNGQLRLDVRELTASRFPELRMYERPHVLGDFFGFREETLTMDVTLFRSKLDLLVELLTLIQGYLRRPGNERWRVSCLVPGASLVIYPGVLWLGDESFPTPDDARPRLHSWIDDVERIENGMGCEHAAKDAD